MSDWIPTARLEFRDGDLYQRWTMQNHHGEVKFQWRPVPGQGKVLPLGPLIAEKDVTPEPAENPEFFDPSD